MNENIKKLGNDFEVKGKHMEINKTIACIGAGYVGGPTMAMIAAKCPNHNVIVLDINQKRVEAWNSGNPPIFEPGLKELVNKSIGKNLTFSTDIKKGIEEADMIFLAVNTPTKIFGTDAGYASNFQYFELAVRSIKKYANRDKILIEKSTLPVRTGEKIMEILKDSKHNFEILSNPEFLAEGTAINDLLKPDRILIGGQNDNAVQHLVDIYANWVPDEKIITTNLWSSELSKLTANAFLYQRVSSINAISSLCEKVEADVTEIASAIGMDSRIGSKFLKASVGAGGSCFKKDLLNLVYLCRHFGLEEVAQYWEQVEKMNEWQKKRFAEKIVSAMFNTVAGKKIAILGYAFKANTGDTRETPALDIVKYLNNEKAEIWINDPQALPECIHDMKQLGVRTLGTANNDSRNDRRFTLNGAEIILKDHVYEAIEGAHAIAICTDWAEYKNLDWQRIYDNMEKPAFIFDGRIMLDHDKLKAIGFEVHCIGKSCNNT